MEAHNEDPDKQQSQVRLLLADSVVDAAVETVVKCHFCLVRRQRSWFFWQKRTKYYLHDEKNVKDMLRSRLQI